MKTLFLTFSLVVFTPSALAQAGGPPGLPGGGGPVTAVPVDGGLGLLALAGGAYAIRRLRQRPDR